MLRRTIIAFLGTVLLCQSAFAQALVHLTFDDPQDLAADQSGQGNHGNKQGNLTASSAGRSGGAAVFDGASAIELGAPVAQALGGSFTVSLWVRTTQEAGSVAGAGETGAGLLFAQAEEQGDQLPVAITGDKAGFGQGESTLHSQSAINHGDWVNVVVTRDRETGISSLFVNGQLEANAHGSATAQAVHDLLLLGANPGQGFHFAGELDDFQLYDRAIPASDVAFLHANPGSALFQVQAVPEPSTTALMASGLIVAFSLAWRQRRRSAAAARPKAARLPTRHACRQATPHSPAGSLPKSPPETAVR